MIYMSSQNSASRLKPVVVSSGSLLKSNINPVASNRVSNNLSGYSVLKSTSQVTFVSVLNNQTIAENLSNGINDKDVYTPDMKLPISNNTFCHHMSF